jgi:hypothetical protein
MSRVLKPAAVEAGLGRVGVRDGAQASGLHLDRLPQLPPHLRDAALPARLERGPGAAVARPLQALVHLDVYVSLLDEGRARAEVLRRAGRSRAQRPDHFTVSRHPAALGTQTTGPNSRRPSTFPMRVFVWPALSYASFNKVEFFRRGREVFTALSSAPRLELPHR